MPIASRHWKILGDTSYPLEDIQLLDPGELYQWCIANDIDPSPFWGKANRIHEYIGCNPQPSYLLLGGVAAEVMYREIGTPLDPFSARYVYFGQRIEITDSGFTPTVNAGDWSAQRKMRFGGRELWVTSMVAIGPDGDGKVAYLATLHDFRYFIHRQSLTVGNSSATNRDVNYNATIPGSTLAAGYLTGAVVSWQTIYSALQALASSLYRIRFDNDTLPTITETADNFGFSGNVMEAIKYIHELHNVTWAKDLRNTTDDTLVTLGTTSSSITSVMDTLKASGRQVYDARSRGFNEYIDYPANGFIVGFQKKITPICSQITLQAASQHVYRLGGAGGSPPTAFSDTIAEDYTALIYSPMFAELSTGSSTANNEAALDSLADEYETRFLGRMTTANAPLHRNFTGLVDSIPLGNQVHEVVWRDYGDSDGLITEIRGGREVLRRLLGEPLGMLTKPLMTHPELGLWRHPSIVNTTQGIGQLTTPTTNSSLSTTLYLGTPGAETSTSISVTAYYIGPTISSGTKRVLVWSNGAGSFYSV